MMKNTDTEAANLKDEARGVWTRQEPNNPTQKTALDYIITARTNKCTIKEIHTDEERTLILKGKKESDHNTIITKLDVKAEKAERKIKRWKLDNKEGWKNYNSEINDRADELTDMGYQEYIDEIRNIMKRTIGEKTITTGRRKLRETKEVKTARETTKQNRKKYKETIKNDDNANIKQNLDNLIKSQTQLRNEIEKSQKTLTQQNLEKMKSEGTTKSNAFWKHRANIIGKFSKDEYDTINEEGRILTDPEEAKEHIAQFYEDLYQARPAKPEEIQRTQQIERETEDIKETMKTLPKPNEITKKELQKAAKRLKRKKACGPDNIPNETIIEANEKTNEVLRNQLNKILNTAEIPDEWQHGEITRLYKGKGKKGQCSNERGITLASNIGKLFERIINERLRQIVEITDAQAGGRAGSATTDHLLILNQAIKSAKNRKKDMYVGFLDVTKAYDKAWITAIMHILYERGLTDAHWETVLKLNENLTAKLKTKYGLTRTINIKDSLRQGGVLAVLQYGIMMDQINQAIKAQNLGIKIEGTNTQIPSLLWVDDVLIMAETKEELQKMLDIINDIAAKYHIEFGMPKSNVMKVTGRKEAITMVPLGNQAMTQTNKYKYLGFTQTSENNLQEHLTATRGKTEGAYQKILTVAGDNQFKNIELKVIWELIDAEIAPIALNTAEVWEPTKQENDAHNRILDNLLKRILKVPRSTPREALYIELGILDLEWRRKKNRINMEQRVNKKGSETTKTVMNAKIKGGWKEKTDALKQSIDINETNKNITKTKINEAFKKDLEAKTTNKSKIQHLLEGKREEWGIKLRHPYLNELTRNQTSAIFKARTRMIRAKSNEKGAHTRKNADGSTSLDLGCRFCQTNQEESQKHLFEECSTIHNDATTKITNEEIFAEYDREKTKATANKIISIIDLIDKNDTKRKRKEYKPKYPCIGCDKQVKEQQNAIECTSCKKWTHLKCTRVTEKEFEKHNANTKATWHCTKCAVLKKTNATNLKIRIKGNKEIGWTCQPVSMKITLRKNQDETWKRKDNGKNYKSNEKNENEKSNEKNEKVKSNEKNENKNDTEKKPTATQDERPRKQNNGMHKRIATENGTSENEPRQPPTRDAKPAPQLPRTPENNASTQTALPTETHCSCTQLFENEQ